MPSVLRRWRDRVGADRQVSRSKRIAARAPAWRAASTRSRARAKVLPAARGSLALATIASMWKTSRETQTRVSQQPPLHGGYERLAYRGPALAPMGGGYRAGSTTHYHHPSAAALEAMPGGRQNDHLAATTATTSVGGHDLTCRPRSRAVHTNDSAPARWLMVPPHGGCSSGRGRERRPILEDGLAPPGDGACSSTPLVGRLVGGSSR